MRETNRTDYLTEDELLALINEVEQKEMIAAPQYLEEKIVRKMRQQSQIVEYKDKISTNRKLLTYSLKIMVAAAAAIAILIVVPTVEQGSYLNTDTYVTQAREDTQKELAARKEEVEKQRKTSSVLETMNDATNAFCNQLFEGTNRLFQKEDK